MKISFILLLLGAFAAADRDPRCPIENPGDLAVHLPHDTECTKFYKCDGEGHRIELNCDEGLHYDPELQLCDWPHGECEIGCRPGEDNDHPKHLPHPTDCTKFYKCNGFEPLLQECPEGLHWCEERDYCDYPGIAKCNPLLG